MALQTLNALMAMYPYYNIASVFDTSNNYLLDAAGEKYAAIFKVPKAGDITHIGFVTSTISNSQTLRVGIETLDASGDPSGTQYGGSAVGTQTSPAANTYYEVALGTAATVSSANVTDDVCVAVVIQFDGTLGSVNLRRINQIFAHSNFPYDDVYVASWTKGVSYLPSIIFKYSDESYFSPFTIPISSTTTTAAFNSGSTPDERALKFQLPFPAVVKGCWADLAVGITADFDLVLYDSDGTTALDTISINADNLGATSQRRVHFLFSATVNLSANTWYRLSVKPTTANSLTLTQFTVNSTAILDSVSGGQNCYLSTRVDAGSWTDTATTTRPMLGLLLCGFDDGVGGGAGGEGPLIGGRLIGR